jgi:hypothetical protein
MGTIQNEQFDFERLEVYQLALEFLDRLFEIVHRFSTQTKYTLAMSEVDAREGRSAREHHLAL